MRVLVLVGLFATAALEGVSQIVNVYGAGGKVLRVGGSSEVVEKEYLFEEWNNSSLVDVRGNQFDNLKVNYDSFTDRLVLLEGDKLVELDPLVIRKALFTQPDGEKVVLANGYQIDNLSSEGYYTVLFDGRIKLLRRVHSELSVSSGMSYGNSGDVKQIQESVEYYLITDTDQIRLKRNRSNLREFFDKLENATEINGFIKSEKINLKDDSGVITVLKQFF